MSSSSLLSCTLQSHVISGAPESNEKDGMLKTAIAIYLWRRSWGQRCRRAVEGLGIEKDHLRRMKGGGGSICLRYAKCIKNPPGTIENQTGTTTKPENLPGTIKNQPGTMKNHENCPGTMKNHENPPGTIKNHEKPTWNCKNVSHAGSQLTFEMGEGAGQELAKTSLTQGHS